MKTVSKSEYVFDTPFNCTLTIYDEQIAKWLEARFKLLEDLETWMAFNHPNELRGFGYKIDGK